MKLSRWVSLNETLMLTGDSVPVAGAQTLPRRHLCEELTIAIVHKNHHLKTHNTL